MKEYTVDFESYITSEKTDDWNTAYKECKEKAYKNHSWGIDDDLYESDSNKSLTGIFNSLYITAKNYEDAWDKANHFAKLHNLDVIEIDDGYDTDYEETTLEDLEN